MGGLVPLFDEPCDCHVTSVYSCNKAYQIATNSPPDSRKVIADDTLLRGYHAASSHPSQAGKDKRYFYRAIGHDDYREHDYREHDYREHDYWEHDYRRAVLASLPLRTARP